MGRRGKLEIKKIEGKKIRQVSLSKRRNGLFKKARQLSLSCDVQVAGIVFSSTNKLYPFSSANSLTAILQQYHDVTDSNEREVIGIHDNEESEYVSTQGNESCLQRVQKYLDGLNLDQLGVNDLVQLEKDMKTVIAQTKETKFSVNARQMMTRLTTLQEREKLLREENELLGQQIAAMVEENITAKETVNDRGADIELNNLANNETNHSPAQQQAHLLLFE